MAKNPWVSERPYKFRTPAFLPQELNPQVKFWYPGTHHNVSLEQPSHWLETQDPLQALGPPMPWPVTGHAIYGYLKLTNVLPKVINITNPPASNRHM